MKISIRVLIWIAMFICLFSALLSIFFFVQVWLPAKREVDLYIESNCFIGNITVYAKQTNHSCHVENSDLWWYPKFTGLFNERVVDKGSDPDASDDWVDPGPSGICYIGILDVSYLVSGYSGSNSSDSNHDLLQSQITGLWSANPSWIEGYLSIFSINETIKCYYSNDDPTNVLPFAPILQKVGWVIGIVFSSLGGASLLSIIILSIIKIRTSKNEVDDHHHHHHHHRIIIPNNDERKALLSGDYYKYEDEISPPRSPSMSSSISSTSSNSSTDSNNNNNNI